MASYTTAIAQDRNALELLAGGPVADAWLPSELPANGDWLAAVPAGLSSEVLLNRPDVLQVEHQLKAGNANIGAAFFPSVSLTGAGGVASGALSSLFGAGAGVWSFAPSITLPIFDGGANKAGLAYSEAQRKVQVASYELAVQTAFEEVANALATHGTIAEQVLVAQRTLYNAQQALVTTRLDALQNQVTLYRVLGGGLTGDTPAAPT